MTVYDGKLWNCWIHCYNAMLSANKIKSGLYFCFLFLNWRVLSSIKLSQKYCSNIGFPAHFCHLFIKFHHFQFNFVRRSLLRSNLKFNFVKLSFTFIFCQSNLTIQHSNSSIITEIRHSFKQIHYFVIQIRQVLLGFYIWETILIETLTKMNANRRHWFGCLVLSYCDRRIWIAVDENGWQSTKLNGNVSKLIDQRRNWNEHSHNTENTCRRNFIEIWSGCKYVILYFYYTPNHIFISWRKLSTH